MTTINHNNKRTSKFKSDYTIDNIEFLTPNEEDLVAGETEQMPFFRSCPAPISLRGRNTPYVVTRG
jgi:hypothetical protein